jgi:glucose/arabinose dehydrogenase
VTFNPYTTQNSEFKTQNSKKWALALILVASALALLAVGVSRASGVASVSSGAPDEGTEPLPYGVSVQTVVTGLERPVSMAFDPQGRLFITERATGFVRLYANGILQAAPVMAFPIDECGERGLLGITLDPNFTANHYVYVFYTQLTGCVETQNKVVRFVENNGVGSDPVTIFSSPQSSPIHNGGNIYFGPDGKLYVSVGDNGNWINAQDLTLPNGKIHRINPDGTIPDDNPVFTQTGTLPSIYAFGLRNSFDFTFDPLSPGRIFATENGPNCDDELNRIEAGYNYGWRFNYPCEDNDPDPTYNTIDAFWFLPQAICCEAPTGVIVYTGHQIPQWRNHLFMATYNGTGKLRHFYLNADRTLSQDVNVVEGVTPNMDLANGPDGALWFIDGGGWNNGTVRRLVGTGVLPTSTPVPTAPPSTPSNTPTPVPTVPANGCPFTDMPEANPFYDYVSCLACGGIVSGYPCGGDGEPCDSRQDPYFRPNNGVTRGQLSKIVASSMNYSDSPGAQVFEDVTPTDTFYVWVQRLANRGVMGGYECGSVPGEPCIVPYDRPYFRPNVETTRGQISKIVAIALGFTQEPTGRSFEDVPPGSTFYTWVEELASLGVMGGYPCGGVAEPCQPGSLPYFRPDSNATRGQVSKIVANAFFPRCNN